jgi:hypothetical protein
MASGHRAIEHESPVEVAADESYVKTLTSQMGVTFTAFGPLSPASSS